MLPQGLILRINALGLENSLRNAKDGYVFFGSQEYSENVIKKYLIKHKNKNIIIYFNHISSLLLKGFKNDYIIRSRENEYEDDNIKNK